VRREFSRREFGAPVHATASASARSGLFLSRRRLAARSAKFCHAALLSAENPPSDTEFSGDQGKISVLRRSHSVASPVVHAQFMLTE
jgi:hypothetical protein